MVQLRKSIVVLLPVFWLATFGYGSFESLGCATLFQNIAASSPSGEAAPETGDPCCLAHDLFRSPTRMQTAVRNLEYQPPRIGFALSEHPSPPPVSILAHSLTGDSFLLQQRWQFLWRTADSPRAPSSLA